MNHRQRRLARLAACAAFMTLCSLLQPGCIIGDIRDEMVTLNGQVARVNEQMDTLEVQLEELKTLTPVNERLAEIDGELTEVDERMVAVKESLELTNAHLSSLRRTISNIDSTIPFLKIADDEDPGTEAMQPEDGEAGKIGTEAGS